MKDEQRHMGYISNGIVFNHLKKWRSCYLWQHRLWEHYAKWNNLYRKRQILYDFSYMWKPKMEKKEDEK